jgi:hypothetical protein
MIAFRIEVKNVGCGVRKYFVFMFTIKATLDGLAQAGKLPDSGAYMFG